MNRLSVRLLLSFGLVLMMTLTFSFGALLVVLRSRPVNWDTEYIDLASGSLEISARNNVVTVESLQNMNFADERALRIAILEAITSNYHELSNEYGVRIILVQNENEIIFDTDGIYPRPISENTIREPFLDARNIRTGTDNLAKGTFEEEGKTWLFVQQPFTLLNLPRRNNFPNNLPNNNGNGNPNPPNNNDNPNNNGQAALRLPISVVVATPAAERTFGTVFRETIGSGFLAAGFQAILIGMTVSFILSLWIVSWVSRPLHHVVQGAKNVANGDYSTRVPITGPRETKMLASAFNDMARRVELSQQAQRDFLANVSHDLRTPLTSIQGFAQAIMDGVADRKVAEIIHSEASRLNRMVNDLLDLARIEAGRMDMLRQAVELDSVLENVGQSLTIKAQNHAVNLEVNVPKLPRIAGDGDRLAQVFTNLVDNAIKHTPEGGNVWLNAKLDDGTQGILIEVADTGEGIPAQDLPRLFERFYQVDKSRAKRSGSGLGLAITHEIIKAHHGKIWVESDFGQGASFKVWLPQPMGDTGQTVMMSRLAG